MKCAIAVLAVVITSGRVAAGEPAAAPATSPPAPVAQPGPEERLSENLAFGLSFGAAVVSWTLLGVGFSMGENRSEGAGYVFGSGVLSAIFAPTIGHWYARRSATRGLGMRAAGTVAVGVGFGLAVRCEEDCPGYSAAFALLMVGGAGLLIAGTIDDIVTAPRAARSYNAKRDRSVVPVVNPATRSFGLALSGSF